MKWHNWIAVPAAVYLVAAHALSASAEVRLRIVGQHPRGFVKLAGFTPKSQQIVDGCSTQFCGLAS